MKVLVVSVLICVLGVKITSFKIFSALNSIVFTNVPTPKDKVHSEYYFGRCSTRYKELLIHDHLKYEKIKGLLLVRGYINVTDDKLPNCIYVKSTSNFGDMVRYNAYKFTVCLIRIVHNYRGEMHVYHGYEWYLPTYMRKGIDWDVYLYYAY